MKFWILAVLALCGCSIEERTAAHYLAQKPALTLPVDAPYTQIKNLEVYFNPTVPTLAAVRPTSGNLFHELTSNSGGQFLVRVPEFQALYESALLEALKGRNCTVVHASPFPSQLMFEFTFTCQDDK